MHNKLLFSTALIGASFYGLTPAFADFTPSEALDRYFETTEAFGSTVSVDIKEELNGKVRWTGIVITDENTGSTTTMDWLEASSVSPDSVKIVLGPKIVIEGKDPSGDVPPINFQLDLLNNEVVLTEAGELLNAAYAGERLSMTSSSSDPEVPLEIDMTVANLTGEYTFTGQTKLDGSASTGEMTVSYGLEDEELSFTSDTTMSSSEVSFSADIPDEGDIESFLDGDKSVSLTYTLNDTDSRTSFEGDEGSGWVNSQVELSAGSFQIKDGAVALLGEAQNISYSGQLPMPGFPEMSASMTSASLNMNMTFGKQGEVAPLAFAMTMEELEVDEAIWGMFDPTGAIPREPATLRIDLGAEALWMSESVETSIENAEPPFMPQSMKINDVFLTVGGASLSATGEGILSQQTMQPSGLIQVELRGVLGLVQTLSEIGIVPVPQAMMVQGMLPQFTRPGPDGADHFLSDIEAMPDGSILVNGTRVK